MQRVALTQNELNSGAMVLPPCVSQCPSNCIESRILRRLLRTLKKGGHIGLVTSEVFKDMPNLQDPYTGSPKTASTTSTSWSNSRIALDDTADSAELPKEKSKVQFVDASSNVHQTTNLQQLLKSRIQKKKPATGQPKDKEEKEDPIYLPYNTVSTKCEKSVASSKQERYIPPSRRRVKSIELPVEKGRSVSPSSTVTKSKIREIGTASRFERAKSVAPFNLRISAPSVTLRTTEQLQTCSQTKLSATDQTTTMTSSAYKRIRFNGQEKSSAPISSKASETSKLTQKISNVPSVLTNPIPSALQSKSPITKSVNGSVGISLSVGQKLPVNDVVVIKNKSTSSFSEPSTCNFESSKSATSSVPDISTASGLPKNISLNAKSFSHTSSLNTADNTPLTCQKKRKRVTPLNVASSKKQKGNKIVTPSNSVSKPSLPAATSTSTFEASNASLSNNTPTTNSKALSPTTPNSFNVFQTLTPFSLRCHESVQYFAAEPLTDFQLPLFPVQIPVHSSQAGINLYRIRFAFVNHIEYHSYIVDFKKLKQVPVTCKLAFYNLRTKFWDLQDCRAVESGACSVGRIKLPLNQKIVFFTVLSTDSAGQKSICPVIVVDERRLNQRCELVFEPDLIVIDDD